MRRPPAPRTTSGCTSPARAATRRRLSRPPPAGRLPPRGCHSARRGRHPETPVPVITRGEDAYIWDNQGRKILDGLSGLFVVQVGHGRRELAEAAAKQAAALADFPGWGDTP